MTKKNRKSDFFFIYFFIYLHLMTSPAVTSGMRWSKKMLWPSGERERAHTSVRLTSAASQDGQRSSE